MIIPASYISSFLPVQDLDELQSSTGLAPLHPDDLFLVSQISAYATGEQNAVALSKKLRYGAFRNTLSSEFNVNDIKLSIDGLSNDVHDLSIYAYDNISALSNSIVCSVDVLSSYTNNICANLCTTVESFYVKKYEQDCDLISCYDDINIPATIASQVHLSNGYMTVTKHIDVSSLVIPKNWRISAGAIAGDNNMSIMWSFTPESGQSPFTEIEYAISTDCYLNCMISAYEDDGYSPLQLWIQSPATNEYVLYKTFNNPGGFSGTNFCNYYQFDIPLKKLIGTDSSITTSVKLKYANNEIFKPGGQAVFTEYYFYAVPSKDDLSAYVKRSDQPVNAYNEPKVCKILFNENGLITNATSVYYGEATDTELGLVKTASTASNIGENYWLKLSSNNVAYVTVPRAGSDTYGTVKFASLPSDLPEQQHGHNYGNVLYHSDLSHFLSCSLENLNDVATTFIPCATDGTFGVVKLSSNFYQFDIRERPVDPLSSFLNVDASGHAYVTTPMAHVTNDGTSVPGLIKTGTPDTSEIRVVRSVYLDTDGVAKVNVANQIGVGPFHVNEPNSGYTKRIEFPLSSFTSDSCIVSTFLGNIAQLSDYGSYIATKYENVNSWFMAQLVLDGTSKDYGENDPALQIVCDGIAVTTIHPKQVQNAIGKHFTYSTYLGVFRGELFQDTIVSQKRLFAVASNYTNFGDNTLHFLIKEADFNT